MNPRTRLYRPAFLKDIRRLATKDQDRIIVAVERLAATGHGDASPLTGRTGIYRLRVGKWRAFFRYPDADTIELIGLDNRGQAYYTNAAAFRSVLPEAAAVPFVPGIAILRGYGNSQ